ncbi:MAG TPA: prolyl oligopeptidase family serine peptidase [Gemmatimonadaceae bacterium]|nr:prolyl oligopeptidase family serine peptidase [Gemmatimonadaceae bacterium]
MARSLTRIGAALLAVLSTNVAHAQTRYQQPPAPIAQILDAERTPIVSVSPDRTTMLLLERHGMPSITELAAPEARLAGLRIDPRTNTSSRATTYKGLRLQQIGETGAGTERRIALPAGARVWNTAWSPDGRRIAFAMVSDTGASLWLADVTSATARELGPVRLNGALGTPCTWIDSAKLICRLIPANRGAAPSEYAVPTGPVIQQSMGRAAANRTYQDLLQNSADEARFDYLARTQLAIVTAEGTVAPIGAPGIYTAAEPSPDGNLLLIGAVQRPYSYIVPLGDFATKFMLWDLTGAVVKMIAEQPVRDDVGTSFDAVAKGPRSLQWRADAPATLVWLEALDDGDPAKPVEKRDRVYMHAAPFSGQPTVLLDVATRAGAIRWVRPDLVLIDEDWWRTRRTKTWAVNPANPAGPASVVFDRSSEDRYAHPGTFVTVAGGRYARRVVLTTLDGRYAYLTGAGASAEGDRPFLDRIELATGKTERLWRSAAPYYESVVALLDERATRILTQRESVQDPPNYFVRDLRSNIITRLTRFADPAPQFASVEPRLITYKRADGVQLSGKLFLPPGYTAAQGPLPFLFWAYPEEFRSAAAAAQVVGSPFRFVRPAGTSHLFLLTQGYGILDGPTMPIVGEGSREPNDDYIPQLVASAKAAVDEVVRLGVADRSRIAVGGHSYGAFMTANLLAHSDLFRAGIARSGAYNRTLTPFGFQSEERTFWQARDTYGAMSPFYYADRINEPILLIHGEADNNSGTFPMQSERMYAALIGNRATVRYVVLPAEAHGYAARESVGHTLWEMVSWLDTYVKVARPASARSGQ